MQPSGIATTTLWLVPLSLQFAIAVLMFRRGLYKTFPLFFGYTIWVPTRDALLFLFPYPSRAYSGLYWGGDVAALLVSLGIVFEIVQELMPGYRFFPLARRLLAMAAAAACAVAIFLLRINGYTATDASLEPIVIFERSIRFIQVCVLILTVLIVYRFGVPWHRYAVGIAAGFGIYSAINMALLELRLHVRVLSDQAFVLANSAAYNAAAIIWAYYFFSSWRKQEIERLPETHLADWNEAVTEDLHRWYRRS
ncbi:MAG: hypothetical protein DMG91_05215 [Acidobacteria bacterium]|jgi:hypothetical protein|nr:MAG: hypothetical protein DMG91_05215 [Acidobacteriota bacterium]